MNDCFPPAPAFIKSRRSLTRVKLRLLFSTTIIFCVLLQYIICITLFLSFQYFTVTIYIIVYFLSKSKGITLISGLVHIFPLIRLQVVFYSFLDRWKSIRSLYLITLHPFNKKHLSQEFSRKMQETSS